MSLIKDNLSRKHFEITENGDIVLNVINCKTTGLRKMQAEELIDKILNDVKAEEIIQRIRNEVARLKKDYPPTNDYRKSALAVLKPFLEGSDEK